MGFVRAVASESKNESVEYCKYQRVQYSTLIPSVPSVLLFYITDTSVLPVLFCKSLLRALLSFDAQRCPGVPLSLFGTSRRSQEAESDQ